MKPQSTATAANKIEAITTILNPTRWTYKFRKHKGREETIISISSVQNEP
jgi:hypothetical protein